MDAGGPKGKAKSDINVTPLIDIVLVLLIVFIIMVPGLSKALPVVVPKVEVTDKPTPPDKNNPPLVIDVIPSPNQPDTYVVQLQSKDIEVAQISEQLIPAVQMQPLNMRKVFLKVDEEAPYQIVVSVLDQVRVASEAAKAATKAKPEMAGLDGGEVKVAASIKKRA